MRSDDQLFLLLDGVLSVEVDGTGWAEVGPGAVLGERAAIEGGARTATLRAVTPVRVAAVAAAQIDRDKLMRAGRRPPARGAVRQLMLVHLCGVRGSMPAAGPAFQRVGGNTSCVAFAHDTDERPTLILDAGTGLRNVAGLLDGAPFLGSVLLSHLHWDHTQGLPFFTAGDRPDSRVDLWLPVSDGAADHVLDPMMGPPFFPIRATDLQGRWGFHALTEGTFEVEGFTVLVREVPHPGGRTFGFRVERRPDVGRLRVRPRADRPRPRA